MKRRFIQTDVFTATPTYGNALAVVLDGDGLTDEQMQQFAAWTNLAETTFIQQPTEPGADYLLRIFTPVREMLFAGHPTLGSCAAWLHAGGVPRNKGIVRQECGVGLVDIDLTGQVPAFVAPPTRIEALPVDQAMAIVDAIGIPPDAVINTALLTNGPQWQVLALRSAGDVMAANSAAVRWPQFKSIGLIGPHEAGAECDAEVRMLAPSSGMSEDPITGSLNAAIARWKLSLGELDQPMVVAQGTSIGRQGRVYIRPDTSRPGEVLIGGQSHVLIEGTVEL